MIRRLKAALRADLRARGEQRTSRVVWCLLGLLLVWSLGLRIWFACWEPHPGRGWDERFGLENIASILRTGSLRPANGYYPALHHLPQAAALGLLDRVAAGTGVEQLRVFDRGRFSPAAYIVCRGFEAVYGAASIFLVFLIGRRLFSPWTGLFAALLCAAVPWHIEQSAVYKPDSLLVFTLVLAFWLSLRALERPTVLQYLAVGGAIGLVLSSKFNGAPIVLPIVVGTLWIAKRLRWRTALALLIVAGLSSLIVFFVINSYALLEPGIYISSFRETVQDYEWKGARRAGGSHLAQIGRAAELLVSRYFHKALVGAFALAGLLGMAVRLWLDRREGLRNVQRGLLIVFVVGYTLMYALATSNPVPHNWVMLVPFTSVAAAWCIVGLWRRLTSLLGPVWQGAAAIVVFGVSSVWLGQEANLFVYRVVVPHTVDMAMEVVARRSGALNGRYVMTETRPRGGILRRGKGRLLPIIVEPLSEVPRFRLDRADAEILLAANLRSTRDEFYFDRLSRVPGKSHLTIAPSPFRLWGPRVEVALHPWRVGTANASFWLERSAESSSAIRYTAPVPADLRGRLVSVDLWFKIPEEGKAPALRLSTGSEATSCRYIRVRYAAREARCPRTIMGDRLELDVERSTEWRNPQRIAVHALEWEGVAGTARPGNVPPHSSGSAGGAR